MTTQPNFEQSAAVLRSVARLCNPFGAPPPGFVFFRYTAAEIAAIKAAGVITAPARWDCASQEQRMIINPAFNSKKRWFEQPENRPTAFHSKAI